MLGSTLILMWFIFTGILVAMTFSYFLFDLGNPQRWRWLTPRARAFASRFYGHGFQALGLLVVLFSVIAELAIVSEPVAIERFGNFFVYLVSTLGFSIGVGVFGVLMILCGQKISEKYLTKSEEPAKQKNDFFEALQRLEDEKPTNKTNIKMTLDELIEYERID